VIRLGLRNPRKKERKKDFARGVHFNYTDGGVGGSNQLGREFFSYKTGGFQWYAILLNLNFVCDI